MRFVACVLLSLMLGGLVRAEQPQVDFDFVIDALKDTGTWQANAAHKFDYQPKQQDGWAPYRNGQWIYTDYGWTWKGADNGSWMIDHYGYWTRRDTDGGHWAWVPGGYWLPSTVEWLRSGDYLGWRASKVDRFSNALEPENVRYSDPNEWNFVLADKIRGPLTVKDFATPDKAKDLLVSAQPVDHTFTSYREIDRPGPDPAILKPEDGRKQFIVPSVTDLPAIDAKPDAKATPKEYYVYRPKFYQDDDGVFRRIELFLNPKAKEQNQEQLNQMTQADADAAKKQSAAEKKQEEWLELQRKHNQDLYR
jgi:hypothetical protein